MEFSHALPWWGVTLSILGSLVASMLWSFCTPRFLETPSNEVLEWDKNIQDRRRILSSPLFRVLWILNVANREEVWFRLLPVTVSWALYHVLGSAVLPLIYLFLLGVQVRFGFLHGGWQGVAQQGVTGVFDVILFLVCAGGFGCLFGDLGVGFLACFISHAAWNGFCEITTPRQRK